MTHSLSFASRPTCFLVSSLLAVLSLSTILSASTTTREAFRGISHIQRTDWPNIPRAVTANILIIDLDDPDISFRVTEPTGTPDPTDSQQFLTQRERTLAYLTRVNAQVAINANFDNPGAGYIYSLAASQGTPYSKFEDAAPALNIDSSNSARIVTRGVPAATYQTAPSVNLYNAVGGNERIVFQGGNTANPNDITGNRARTVAGLTQDNKTLVIMTVDEGSPQSRGVSPREAADMLIEYGVWDAINLDGGGSTALAMADPSPRLVNLPSANPTRQNVNNLAIFASPAPLPPEDDFLNIRVTPGMAEALVSWQTAEPTSAWVEYGRNASFIDSRSLRSPTLQTDHTFLLNGLTAGVIYYYRLVVVIDGEEIRSNIGEFNTQGVEIIVDDSDAGASFSGSWNTNTQGTGWGATYRWASVSPSPTAVGTYTPEIPVAGYYQVHTWYLASGNRATNTRFGIEHADGEATVRINQQILGGLWRHLASNLRFEAGETRPTRIFNDASGGDVVIADAIRWTLTQALSLPHGEVPEWWLTHFFDETGMEPDTDASGNGFTLADEYFLGVAPVQSGLNFRFRMERDPDGELHFMIFPTYSDRQYILQVSAELDEWNPAIDQEFSRDSATGQARITIPPPESDRIFFRLHIER